MIYVTKKKEGPENKLMQTFEGDAIPGNTLLTSIQTLVTYEKPLIIKSKKNMMIGADESFDLLKEEKKKGILRKCIWK